MLCTGDKSGVCGRRCSTLARICKAASHARGDRPDLRRSSPGATCAAVPGQKEQEGEVYFFGIPKYRVTLPSFSLRSPRPTALEAAGTDTDGQPMAFKISAVVQPSLRSKS